MKCPIPHCFVTAIALLVSGGPLFAWQEAEDDADLLETEDTWQGRNHFQVYRRIPHRVAKPGQEVLSRVRVEWRGVELEPKWHALGIRGRLVVDGGREVQPVDWFQGVRVLLFAEREVRVEWPGQPDPDNSSCADALLEADGTFIAYFSLFDAPRAAGMKRSCLAAAVLGKPKGSTITYDDRARPVAGSVTRLTLPPGPTLDRALQSLNAASPWPSRCADPAAIIRAVNRLQVLGKDQAFDALRRYVAIAPDGPMNFHREFFDPTSIDQGNRNIAFWIVRLLFEPAQSGMRIRVPGLGAWEPHPDANDMKLWPLFPIELVDDVPFMIADGLLGGGRPEHPLSYIELAERNGVLRDAPLRPADPLAAADRLLSLPKSRRLKIRDTHIRTQAWQFVANLFPSIQPDPDHFHQISPEQWDELRKAAADGEIRWSEEDEAYVIGEPRR